jgi:predicted nuclease of predicted toxin-antitoxin system
MNSFTSAVDPKILIDFSQLAPQTVSDNNALVYLTDQSQYYNVAGADNGKPKCLLFRDQNVNTENYNKLLSRSDYAVNIKILNATSSVADNSDIVVDDLTVKAYDSNVCDSNGNVTTGSVSNSSAISNLTLRSDGFYNGTRQEIVAQIPPRDPVSGVLDFVLFSESDITKGY